MAPSSSHSPSGQTASKSSFGETASKRLKSLFQRKNSQQAKMVNPAFVLLPLYIYPTSTAWNILYGNITANPGVNFTIVINPNNGPGTGTYPDPSYISGISQLNSYSNTQVVGYVHTTNATRAKKDVQSDINKYANWENYASADIHMDGIFFDEAPGTWSTANYNYMSSVASYARSTIYRQDPYVIFNPGVIVDSRYYQLADNIVAFEDYYSAYSPSSVTKVPQANRAKSSFLIHDFTGSVSDQTNVVNTLLSNGIAGAFISTQDDYNSWSNLWGQFTMEMNGGS